MTLNIPHFAMVTNALQGIRYDGRKSLSRLPGHESDPSHDAQGVQTAGCLGTFSARPKEKLTTHSLIIKIHPLNI